MANAMRKLAESPGTVEQMGIAARQFAEKFSWDRAANDTLVHLEEVMTAKGEVSKWK
jgi:glycosyltransferase involved in cell wall biosynthesis